MRINPAQWKISSQKDSFKGWGGVFVAIIATAAVVGLIVFYFAGVGLRRDREGGAKAFAERQEKGPSLFAPLLKKAKEASETTPDTE